MSEFSKITVCALTLYPYDLVPGQRFRIEQWEPYLKEDNIFIDYYSFADGKLIEMLPQRGKFLSKSGGLAKAFVRRLFHLSMLSKYDVILIYRAAAIIGPAFLERLIKLSGCPIVYDFDDAIFLTDSHKANRLFSWMKFARKTATICRLSTNITVGNSWLAQYALKFNQNVTIIPSSVDTNIYSPKTRTKHNGDKVIVGWTGSSTSQTYLEMFAPVLRKLVEKRSDVEIHVHSDRSPDLPNVPFIWHRWSPETEVEIISKFDIGIMPMPDDIWSQGKCSMKALLYMSLGIPTVCSNIGMNREVIKQGENGFLAETSDEWLKSIRLLVDNSILRNQIGEKARQTVVEKYSMRKCAKTFAQVIKDTVEKSK
jgi:glycosyltransferase involved in cell wall biosynthesis